MKNFNKTIKLSKLFSREKGVWYAYLWNESDRLGFKKYLKYEVVHNLFLRKENKISVWYDSRETDIINQKIRDKVIQDKNFIVGLLNDLAGEWKYISPYIKYGKKIKHTHELQFYYNHLTKWWAAMAILFRCDLSGESAKLGLEYRKKAEKFSDIMVEVWNNFWIDKKEELRDIRDLVTPKEAFSLDYLSAADVSLIKNRLFGIVLFNGSLYPLKKIKKILRENNLELEEEVAENESIFEFKGSVAHEGAVEGYARVILLNRDIQKMKKDEILVAEMTSPNYLPAIKKAAAIITDEGGITCHAAIVAREMKKPCIIGTRIATKVLKDGDKIKVDANGGIVHILKKFMPV